MRQPLVAIVLAAIGLAACSSAIERWKTEPPTNATASKDFNLLWSGVDENGVPLNPHWGSQDGDLQHLPATSVGCQPTDAPKGQTCTDQTVKVDPAQGLNLLICSAEVGPFHGHANWTPASLTGHMSWSNWASDYDINFAFIPDDLYGGLTTCNDTLDGTGSRCVRGGPAQGRYIELEYAADELLAPVVTPWWTTLRTAIQRWADSQGNVDDVGDALNRAHHGQPPRATVVGLFGLDCEHGCKSEVHPVYALAVETDDNPAHNEWAIIARNWGTEGFCSTKNHLLDAPSNVLRIRLPSPSTTQPIATPLEFAASAEGTPQPAVDFLAGTGMIVTIALPPPDAAGIVEFVVALDWTAGGSATAMTHTPLAPLGQRAGSHHGESRLDLETAREVRRTYERKGTLQPSKVLPTTAITVRPFDPHRVVPVVPPPVHRVGKQTPADKKAIDKAVVRTMCAKNGNVFPGVSTADGQRICAAAK